MDKIIRVENVSKRFRDQVVLDNVSLSLEKGKIYGLVGQNGSGKTVLMKIICGILLPDEGKVFVREKQIGKDIDFPENLGLIIETPSFYKYESGLKNLIDLASIQKKCTKEDCRKTMQFVGLNPDDKKWVSKYSLGMRQRLGIAQAIMEGQDILIMDEPMNGLDKYGVEEMRTLFLRLKEEGKTIILASHSEKDIEVLCDKVYEIDAGHLME